ncbi:MAG TPA: hypothetical protein VN934_07900 [Candidatus Tumulicola sp.]|nr:hypothetical protein [Candidatus Tumulicola sp.]
MIAYFTSVLLFALWEVVRPKTGLLPPGPRSGLVAKQPRAAALVVMVALVALFALQLALLRWAAYHQQVNSAWFYRLPIPIVTDRGPFVPDIRQAVSLSLLAIVIAQCAALYLLHRILLSGSGAQRGLMVAGCAALVAMAVFAPVVTSGDIYAYVSDALLGWGAYHPTAQRLPGNFGLVNDYWGSPPWPSPYGPLFIALDHYIVGGAKLSLFGSLLLLRFINAAGLVAVIVLLRRLKVEPATIALLACNPYFIFELIADGHNDMLALALTLGAFSARSQLVAAALAIAAGLIKLPYAFVCAICFAAKGTLAQRLALTASVIITAVTVSVLVGGLPYVGGLGVQAVYAARAFNPERVVPHGLALAFAVIALIAALVAARKFVAAAWAMPALTINLYPWYLTMGLPYAIYQRSALPVFCVLYPLAAFALDPCFSVPWLPAALVAAPLVFAAFEMIFRRRVPEPTGQGVV